MGDYAYLVNQLRRLNIKYGDEAADAIEVLEKQNEMLMEANNELAYAFRERDEAYKRIAELEAALRPFADASDLHLGSDDMSIAFRIIIGNLRRAHEVLGEK